MNLVKSLLGLALIFAVSTTTFAQDTPVKGKKGKTAEQMAERQTVKLTKTLNLSEAQAAQVKAINLKYATERKDIKGNATQSKTVKEKLKALGEQQQQEIRAVLNEEQLASYDQQKAEMMEKRKAKQAEKAAEKAERKAEKMNPDTRAVERTAKMKEMLSLTGDQEKQLMELNLDFFTKKYNVYKEDGPREEKKKVFAPEREAYHTKLKTILSEEQYKTWKSRKKK